MAIHAPLGAPPRPLAAPLTRLLLPYLLAVALMALALQAAALAASPGSAGVSPAGQGEGWRGKGEGAGGAVALVPTSTLTTTVTATVVPTITLPLTAVPVLSPTATPTLTPTATPALSPTATPAVTPTTTLLTPTATPALTPTATPSPVLTSPPPSTLHPAPSLVTDDTIITPGLTTTLHTRDGRLSLTVPAGAAAEPLRLRYTARTVARDPESPWLARFALEAFAPGRGDAPVRTFAKPLTVTLHYTPSDLGLLQESNLRLVSRDDRSGEWRPLASTVDLRQKTVTARTDHFSEFGGISDPKFSGPGLILGFAADPRLAVATARYPLELPPGPGGFAPKLGLAYNSGIADGMHNKRDVGSWAGIGWDLHLGRARTVDSSDNPRFHHYLDLGDLSDEIILANAGAGGDGRWHTRYERYWKIERSGGGGASGWDYQTPANNRWEVWGKDGTYYKFGGSDDAVQYARECYEEFPQSGRPPYRLDLKEMRDPHGNTVTITYTQDIRPGCWNLDYVRAAYPQTVTYNNGRVVVSFSASADENLAKDGWVRSDNPITVVSDPGAEDPGDNKAPEFMETRRLDAIEVRVDGQLVRKYTFGYQTSPRYSFDENLGPGVNWVSYAGTHLLTAVTQVGADGSSALPATTFTYSSLPVSFRDFYGGGYPPNPGNPASLLWPHLSQVANGYGGTVAYGYTETPSSGADPTVWNQYWTRQAVTSRTLNPGLGPQQATTWSYTGLPIYGRDEGNQTFSSVYRGFAQHRETDAAGHTTDRWYEMAVTPIGTPSDLLCNMPNCGNIGVLVGRLLRTEVRANDTTLRHQEVNTWGATRTFTDGSWPREHVDFVHLDQADTTEEGRTRRVGYLYDAYGNVTEERQHGDVSDPADGRTVRSSYYPNTSAWLVGLPGAVETFEGIGTGGPLRHRRLLHYDGNASETTPPVKGDLTRESQGLNHADPSLTAWETRQYEYDAWGNRTAAIDGNGNRTTTAYDATYHAYPVLKSYPVNASDGQPLSESWQYDWGAGLVTRQTDQNGQNTDYEYDTFKRPLKVIRPGDTSAVPTADYQYQPWQDTSTPNRVILQQRETSGTGGTRPTIYYYDGLGRLIQRKVESAEGAQHAVVTTRYDNRGLKSQETAPFFAGQAGAGFWSFWPAEPPAGAGTATWSYDALGRVTAQTDPGGRTTSTSYGAWTQAVTDPKGHKKEQDQDAFGRLAQVREYTGSGPYTLLATTRYAYDPLDRLVAVTDTAGHVITTTYDGAGRKRFLKDPDLGSWSYAYDAQGNLTQQTDARGRVLTFVYDALNRLTSRKEGATTLATLAYDNATAGLFRKGRLWQYAAPGVATTTVDFDSRGRVVRETAVLTDTYVTQYAYDAADRLVSVTYPDGEVATTAYDARWLPASFSSNTQGTLVQSAVYTAAAVPTDLVLGADLLKLELGYSGLNGPHDTTGGSYGDLWSLKGYRTADPANPLLHLQHTWDAARNLASRTDLVGGSSTETFAYDDLDRLTSASGPYNELYAYSAIGNLTSTGAPQANVIDLSFPGPTTGYVAGFGGLILKTTDGRTWSALTSGTTTNFRTIDFADTQTGWAAGFSPTVYKTADGGQTWTPQTLAGAGTLGVDALSPTTAYAAGEFGKIYRTTDGGQTWTQQTSPTSEEILSIHFPSATTGYLAGRNGVVLKTADGVNWTTLNSGTTEILLMVRFLDTQTGWIGGTGGLIRKTTDGGQTWVTQTSGTGGAIRAFAIVDANLVYAVGDGGLVLKTTNGGATWTALPSGTGAMLYHVAFTSALRGWAVGEGGLILATEGGGVRWAQRPTGTGALLPGLSLPTSTTGYAAGQGGVILKTTDGGATWGIIPSGTSLFFRTIDFADAQTGWGAGFSPTVRKTTDGGQTWVDQTLAGAGTLGADAVSPTTAYAAGEFGKIFRTTDGGSTWVQQTSPTAEEILNMDFTGPTSGFMVGRNGVVIKTTDGVNWTALNSGTSEILLAVRFLNTQTGWFGGTGNLIRKTTDGGQTWITQYSQPTGAAIRGLAVIDANLIYAAGDGGLFLKSTNGGASWSQEPTGYGGALFTVACKTRTQCFATGQSGEVFAFDDQPWAPQPTGLSYTYGGSQPHAVTSLSNGTSYTYDANGNMLTRGAQTLTWDAENRLASVVSGTTTTTFAYDAKAARVSKSISGGSSTHYVNKYFEKDVTTGEATKHYFLGQRTVGVKKGSDPVQYVLNEHLGSTAVTADGTSSRTTKYAPYGTTRSESGTGPLGSSSPTERKFTGQRLDASTGLYFYNARYYDPAIGRFLSPDSLVPNPGNPQDLNRYSYVRNNPLKYTDPSGHCIACAVGLRALGAALTAFDLYEAHQAFSDPNSSSFERGLALASLALDIETGGTGAGGIAKRAIKWAAIQQFRKEAIEAAGKELAHVPGVETLLKYLENGWVPQQIGASFETARALHYKWLGQLDRIQAYEEVGGKAAFFDLKLTGNRVVEARDWTGWKSWSERTRRDRLDDLVNRVEKYRDMGHKVILDWRGKMPDEARVALDRFMDDSDTSLVINEVMD